MPEPAAPRGHITMERDYAASLAEVWELWTTKAGIESWWGPDKFRVEVHKLDLRPGGELLYAMIAAEPETVAFMRANGMPERQEARIVYREVQPRTRLAYTHIADFIPGVEPYDVASLVELRETPQGVHMTLSFDAMHDDLWTERAVAGWTTQLEHLALQLRKA